MMNRVRHCILNREIGLTNDFGRTARCQKTNIVINKTLSKVQKTGLVVDRENCYVMASAECPW